MVKGTVRSSAKLVKNDAKVPETLGIGDNLRSEKSQLRTAELQSIESIFFSFCSVEWVEDAFVSANHFDKSKIIPLEEYCVWMQVFDPWHVLDQI